MFTKDLKYDQMTYCHCYFLKIVKIQIFQKNGAFQNNENIPLKID